MICKVNYIPRRSITFRKVKLARAFRLKIFNLVHAFDETFHVFDETFHVFDETFHVFDKTFHVFDETFHVFNETLKKVNVKHDNMNS